jgi:trans-aconitate 2-methyltransferase
VARYIACVTDSKALDREWDAATYDRISDPQTRWGSTVLERLHLEGHEAVLDCGCGSGRVTEQLLRRLPEGRVVALDASHSMLEEARRRLAAYADQVRFVQADLLDLSPATLGDWGPVDAVLSTATFHWIADHQRLFDNLATVLVPGGQLVAQCGGAGNISWLLAIVRALGVERPGEWNYATEAVTRARLTTAGFEQVDVWLNDEPTPFETSDDLTQYLETVCLRQSVGRLPGEERARVLAGVVAAMPDRTIDYVRLNITARRASS